MQVIAHDKAANLIVVKSRVQTTPEQDKQRLAMYVCKLVEWQRQEKKHANCN